MYQVVLPDASLSDMLNLTRAKDALAEIGDGSPGMSGVQTRIAARGPNSDTHST